MIAENIIFAGKGLYVGRRNFLERLLYPVTFAKLVED